MKQKQLKGLGIFLLLMMILTFLARVNYSEQLPRINWSYAVSSSLQQAVRTEGVIGTDSPQLIYGLEGIRVTKLCVSPGEMIEKGDVLYEVDTQDLQRQMNELCVEQEVWQEILEKNGQICAGEDGMILDVLMEAGYRMTDTPVIRYANKETELTFETLLTAHQKLLVHIGDTVKIRFSKSREELSAKINWIQEQNGMYLVTVKLPSGKGSGEVEGTMELKYVSPVYDYVIPTEALCADGERSCIYMLKEKNGILGTELSAHKVDVRVLEQSLTHAAIEEEILEKDMKIIVQTNKELGDGVTVREAE